MGACAHQLVMHCWMCYGLNCFMLLCTYDFSDLITRLIDQCGFRIMINCSWSMKRVNRGDLLWGPWGLDLFVFPIYSIYTKYLSVGFLIFSLRQILNKLWLFLPKKCNMTSLFSKRIRFGRNRKNALRMQKNAPFH